MTDKEAREKMFFSRMQFSSENKWGIPFIRKNSLKRKDIKLLGIDEICKLKKGYEDRTIHFFKEDYKFLNVYRKPEKYINTLARSEALFTPDFSMYTDIPLAMQMFSVFMNRWCGAYWQSYGLTVIPTISWSTKDSYDFCFSGVERGSIVAVSTLGVLREEKSFMDGYNEMYRRLNPEYVYCYGETFKEMMGEVYCIKYNETMGRE